MFFNMEQIISANSWLDLTKSLQDAGTNEKGRVFEELTRLYLRTNPTFSTKIKELWHHSEIPQEIIDELQLQQPEIGVDLVAQINDGSYWAIQCKYKHDRTENLRLNDLGTFFGITERERTYNKLSHRLICTSSDKISRRIFESHPDKLGSLTSADFAKLDQKNFDDFREFYENGRVVYKQKKPRPHQRNAIEKCEKYFSNPNNTRGRIIHPCGAGKSLTAYWASCSLSAKTILITVPSLGLVRQTLDVWAQEMAAGEIKMNWMAVCSDKKIYKQAELGISVSTNPDEIAEFLSQPTDETKLVITTYQSGSAVSEGAKKAGFTFDLGIYDEAHKTVGQRNKAFAHLLHDKNIKVQKRIFLTATERVFKGDSTDILSMDDESVYGNQIDVLSFKKAIEQDPPILSDYKIVTEVVTKHEIEQFVT